MSARYISPYTAMLIASVEIARARAKESYLASFVREDSDLINWKRYCRAFNKELEREGIR